MLLFPHCDTLRLALSREAVPPAVRNAPAVAALDAEQHLWLEPGGPLTNEIRSELRLLGVDLNASAPTGATEQVCCWHQLVPLQDENGAAPGPTAVPVLFELTDLVGWSRLTGEMHRLRGRASIAWRETADGRLLLRVLGPPYYSLLRAGEADGLRAYVEAAPRVWVEYGAVHPLIGQIAPPPGQLLLMRRPRRWAFVEDGAWQEATPEFALTSGASVASHARPEVRLPVPLRLTHGGSQEPAEFWVLRERPFEQLADLLRGAEDSLLANLAVAAAGAPEQPVLVLRTRQTKLPAPILVLNGDSHRSYLKLPNLFVPLGQRLLPALRRDAVRDLLCPDAALVTWLAPRADGTFTPEQLPETAFVPLAEHVTYFREEAPRLLRPWQASGTFDVVPFLTRGDDEEDDLPPAPPARDDPPAPPPSDDDEPPDPDVDAPPPGPGLLTRLGDWFRTAVTRRPRWLGGAPEAAPPNEMAPPRDVVAEAVQKFLAPTIDRQRSQPRPAPEPKTYHPLEEEFLAADGPLDAPVRLALWPKLAGQYQSESRWADAAACWVHALWGSESLAPLALWGWFRAEARAAAWHDARSDVGRCLASATPAAEDVRAVAAFATWAAHQQPPTPDFVARLPAMRHFLEAHEAALPVRAAWLAWTSLARLGGGDPLTLARARDRLLQRLFRTGLDLDLDFPTFLRFAGQDGAAPGGPVAAWLAEQRDSLHDWIHTLQSNAADEPPLPPPPDTLLTTARLLGREPPFGPGAEARFTQAYADLTLAWALARLNEPQQALRLVAAARGLLAHQDHVHRWLLDAYSQRIQQALDGRPPEEPLTKALLAELEQMPSLDRYKIDWLRQQSRILEPLEKVDPYRGEVQRGDFDHLNPLLARLAEIGDRRELQERIQHLLDEAPTMDAATAALPRVLRAALEQAPRLEEKAAVDLLRRVSELLDEPATSETAPLLEKALFVAAHFEQTAYVQQFVARFQHLLDRRHGLKAARAFASLAEQSFRGLRKLGMRDEIDGLLRQMAEGILQGQDFPNLRARLGVNIAGVLPTLLHVAGVWFYDGHDDQAVAVLDEVRSLLFSNRLPPADQTSLARAYIAGLGPAPTGLALERYTELFQHLERVQDNLTTASHFSLSQLGVIETMVRTVVDAGFSLGATTRRWLDEDEYLVRRRIHADMRGLL